MRHHPRSMVNYVLAEHFYHHPLFFVCADLRPQPEKQLSEKIASAMNLLSGHEVETIQNALKPFRGKFNAESLHSLVLTADKHKREWLSAYGLIERVVSKVYRDRFASKEERELF